ncbi:hypothetical protein GE09DRAFT_298990 [Coniochaeta sp. 2T2.1]|nr:hypothetical protein GE09DRAFT_298990 [Coniochaeta sp. 2T2.1]
MQVSTKCQGYLQGILEALSQLFSEPGLLLVTLSLRRALEQDRLSPGPSPAYRNCALLIHWTTTATAISFPVACHSERGTLVAAMRRSRLAGVKPPAIPLLTLQSLFGHQSAMRMPSGVSRDGTSLQGLSIWPCLGVLSSSTLSIGDSYWTMAANYLPQDPWNKPCVTWSTTLRRQFSVTVTASNRAVCATRNATVTVSMGTA